MQSFVVAAGLGARGVVPSLELLSARGAEQVPQLGGPRVSSVRAVPEVDGGWVVWGSGARPNQLIDEQLTDDWAVLAFGEVNAAQPAARAVAEAFASGGAAAVRMLDGSFCAFIVARRAGELHVVCDRIGRLSPSYWAVGERIFLTVHETLLALCGCPFELDPIAAASVVACDWSLTGAPLNRNLRRLGGASGLRWRDGKTFLESYALRPAVPRMSPRDARGILAATGEMCDEIAASARRLSATAREVEAGLTAGLDSRAVLASLLSSVNPEAIRLHTTGRDSSQDVRTAKRIARSLRLRHEQRPPEAPSADAFEAHDRLRAFLANGDTNARASLAPVPAVRPSGVVVAGGGGGEIYRGFYYREAGGARTPGEIAQRLAGGKFGRLVRSGFASELVLGVSERLRSCFESYAAVSEAPKDWLDLFYIHERFARFSAVSARKQDARRWSPFGEPRLVDMAWRLPEPLGDHCFLHRELIWRYLPRAIWWTPINGMHPPAWEGPGQVRQGLRWTALVLQRGRRVIAGARGRSATGSADAKQSAGELFAGPLFDYVSGLLGQQSSIARQLLDAATLAKVLTEHRAKKNQIGVLAALVNMEHYRVGYADAFAAAAVRDVRVGSSPC